MRAKMNILFAKIAKYIDFDLRKNGTAKFLNLIFESNSIV